ncbi:MAG: polysaccharide deacetylase family protein [Planctomycetota bacterium]|jgi:peptidoglycan/xylan/chitin deacetylase (PgdA/CDA1 family)
MGKAALRSLLAQACRLGGVLGSRERAARKQLNILCYHRILPEAEKAAYFCPDLVVTPEAFRAQCRTLAAHHRVLPLAEALAALQEGPQDKPLVALTFDDGYVDNLMYAAPILAEFGQRATFFVVSDLMGTTSPPWYDFVARCVADLAARGEGSGPEGSAVTMESGMSPMDLVEGAKAFTPEKRVAVLERLAERLGQAPTFPPQDLVMNAAQVQELVGLGHEVGSHSVSHEILPLLDRTALEAEIGESKTRLEEAAGQPVPSFCYPNGDFDDRCLEIVAARGYAQAVTTRNGANEADADSYTLRRRFIHEQRLADGSGNPSSTLFRAEVCGLSDRLLRRGGSA